MWHRLAHRVGHRGAFLLFLALLGGAFGESLLTAPAVRLAALHLLLPIDVWGWAWAAAGAVCAVCAFRARDFAAFAIMAGLMAGWAGITARAWLIYHIPQGWVGVAVWSAFAVTVLLIASWPETPPPPGHPPPPVVKPP